MIQDPQLHHVAKCIKPNTLEKVIELFELLGCKVVYRPDNSKWAMVAQVNLSFDIQLAEVNKKPLEGADRINSHIGFISNSPKELIQNIEKWSLRHNLRFEKGQWSEKEMWFDLPDLFVDFAIEIMHASIIEP